jgi:hypothetical protein
MEAMQLRSVSSASDIAESNYTSTGPTLAELLDLAMTEQQRMTLTYKGKLFLAIVPVAQEELIEEVEECFDIQAVKDAHREGGQPIPWEQLKTELEL